MGILECASGASVWRGYAYCKQRKVTNLEEIDSDIFTAKVWGNAAEP